MREGYAFGRGIGAAVAVPIARKVRFFAPQPPAVRLFLPVFVEVNVAVGGHRQRNVAKTFFDTNIVFNPAIKIRNAFDSQQ